MTEQRKFTLSGLHLDDLPDGRRDLAEQEIRGMLRYFERLGDKLDLLEDVELDVVLTNDLAPHVDRISQTYGSASTGPYSPTRKTVAAQGITLTDPKSPPLRASVVLNQETWTKDDGESVALRAYLLLHEVGHVLQQARGTGADWKRSKGLATTNEEQVRREARILWDEYDADLTADGICRGLVLRTDEGKPIGAGEFLVNGFVGCAGDLLGRLCTFVEEEVQPYRMRLGPLDPLYPNAFGLLRELFRVLAHTAALCVNMDPQPELTKGLESLRGFEEFIGEDWRAFLDAMALDNGDTAEPGLVVVWNNTMERLGLKIEDLPNGERHVHVFEPEFCCEDGSDDAAQDEPTGNGTHGAE